MKNEIKILDKYQIENMINSIRGFQVMLDSDLAELYDVETGRLNEQVKRNIKRFPASFMFQLTQLEYENLISQFAISSSRHGGRRKLPYVFTEQGVAMLAGVLRSDIAIDISIQIINSFIQMRKFISTNSNLAQRINNLEQKQIDTDIKQNETNNKIENIFRAIESKEKESEQGIFFEGKFFDAYVFISKLVKKANKSIVLIDNFIDESVLTLFSKRRKRCKVIIYTEKISEALKLDLIKHNKQYPPIEIKIFTKSHDRFLILDEEEIYHFGASLKDLGRRWFAFSKMDKSAFEMLNRLKEAKDIK